MKFPHKEEERRQAFYLPILELDISLQLPNMAISNALLQFLESEKILGDMKLIEPDPFAI